MSHSHIPNDFVKTVLQNGVGRYVCQLQRLTLNFCKSNAGSRGVRDFIENHLLEFTRENPGIVVYLQPRRHASPKLQAEYLNGNKVEIRVNNFNKDEVCKWTEHLRTRSGIDIVRLRRLWHTDTPSIQGVWTPFTNRDSSFASATFPNKKLSEYVASEPTASEKLIALSKLIQTDKTVLKTAPEKSVV